MPIAFRRRRRAWLAASAGAMAAALALPSAGCGPVLRRTDDGGGAGVERVSLGGCGDRVAAAVGQAGPLVLAGDFPARVPAGRDSVRGTVSVTNQGQVRFSGVAAARADVYVTLAGVVVATPFDADDVGLILDLGPGESIPLEATARLRRCDATAGAGSSGLADLLGPGSYEIYATLGVARGTGGPGDALSGGPWPLEIV